jgi:hypothetical protein
MGALTPMIRIKHVLMISCVVLAGPGLLRAQHYDVLVEQMGGGLVTGSADFDNNQWTLGRRVFFRDFDSDFAVNNPGFNALGSGAPNLPAGSQALPGNTSLSWDFLPMRINDVWHNLFYWNGMETDGMPGVTPSDVAFGPLPGPGYLLSLFDKANSKHSVNGDNAVVPGGVIDDTASDGSLHRHRFFSLEDGDGNGSTLPVDGIYLMAMRLKMNGLQDSAPIFMVFGTPGSSVAALDDAAVPWVEQHLMVPGDYNGDGTVNAADYVLWRKGGPLQNEVATLNSVTVEDYTEWRARFGNTAIAVGSGLAGSSLTTNQAVPEPATLMLLMFAAAGSCLRRRRAA